MSEEGSGGVEFQEERTTLLWYGDAPTVETGFGRVTRSITLGLWKTGRYNIVCVGINDRGEDHPLKKLPNYDVVPIPDMQNDPYGYRILPQALEKYKPDVIIALNDPWLLTAEPGKPDFGWFEKTVRAKAPNTPWMLYFPVDGGPFANEWSNLFRASWRAIVYSKYGQKVVLDAAPDLKDKIRMIYHGVDLSTFHVAPDQLKQQVRKDMNIPDDHKFIGIVARNQPRKNIPRGLRIFKYFRDGYAKCQNCENLIGLDQLETDCELCGKRLWEKAYDGYQKASMYLHMHINDPRGHNLPKIISDENVKGLYFPKQHNIAQGVPDNVLNVYYSAFDIMFLPTTGEGFGLPVLESLAAGTPVVATRSTSVIELLEGGGGILVDPSDWFIADDTAQVRRHTIDMEKGINALRKLCEDEEFYEQQVALGQLFASGMGWDRFIEKFDEEISEVLDERVSIIDSFPLKAEPKIICFRPYGSAGDLLCTTPVISELKRRYPSSSITYAVPEKYMELFEGNPYIDTVMPFEKQWDGTRNLEVKGDFGVGKFEFYGIEDKVESVMAPNVPFSRQEIWANNCGLELSHYFPIYKAKDSEAVWASEYLEGMLKAKNIAIKIDTEEPYTRIPVQTWAKTCEALGGDDTQVFAFIQRRPWLNLEEWANACPDNVQTIFLDDEEKPYRKTIALLSWMDIVITGDGSFCHYAAMLGKTLVPVFGPSDFSHRLKHYKNVYPVISQECQFLPCWRNQTQIPCRLTGELQTSKCLDEMKAKDIFTQVLKAMKAPGGNVATAKKDIQKKKELRTKRKQKGKRRRGRTR